MQTGLANWRDAWRHIFSLTFWLNIGLKTKMTLMALVGLTALVGMFSFMSTLAAHEMTDRTLQERIILAQLVANHTDYVLGNVRAQLESAAGRTAVPLADPVVRQTILRETLVLSDNLFRQVWLTDVAGQAFAAEPATGLPLNLGSGIGEVLRGASFVVTSVDLPLGPALIAVVPVRDPDKRLVGTLVAWLDLDASELNAQSVTLGQTGYLEIVDARGVILLSTRAQRLLTQADHGDSLVAMIREGKSLVTNCHNCHTSDISAERETEVIAFAPLKRVPWGVVVRQSETEVVAAARTLQGRIVLFGVIAVMGAVILVWLTTRSVIAPVQDLTGAAQRIADGDLDTPIALRRGDEIGALAHSLDDMRARLHQSLVEAQALNRDLDQRVQDRTRELAAVNAVATAITQTLPLRALLEKALDQVLRVTGVDAGSIFLLHEDTRALVLEAQRGTAPAAAQAMINLHVDDSACGGVIEKGHPVVVPDLSVYRSGAGRMLQQAGLCALVHVPLISRGIALGTLCVGTAQPREYDQDELGLLMAISSQIAIGVENVRLYAELERREQLRGELLEKVIAAQEEERKRIARDLHDDTSQSLSALIYALEAAEATCAEAPVKNSLGTMRQRVAQMLDGVHKLIFDLRPSMLDHLGLFVALRWYAETHLQPLGMRVHLDEQGTLRRLPPRVETALFRVVQEAINNIARHSGARNVRLVFVCEPRQVKIDVRDDGIGFDLTEVARATDQQRGLGLVGMQERVGLLGGQIRIASDPEIGTRISIHLPLEAT